MKSKHGLKDTCKLQELTWLKQSRFFNGRNPHSGVGCFERYLQACGKVCSNRQRDIRRKVYGPDTKSNIVG